MEKEKLAKTLSQGQQKNTLRGGKIKNVKKNLVKNTLDNPFALEWPKITPELEREIRDVLQKSCAGLKRVTGKPKWKEIKKYKGAERKEFVERFKQEFHEKLDQETIQQNQVTNEALSHVLFGYNAIMRALEKDKIAGIIVKKNVQPSFVVKTFLPGCANKCIPLVPLDDLDNILKSDDALSLPHSCMVLGLKPSVRAEDNRFHALYVKLCEAVKIEPNADMESEEEEEEEEEEEGEDQNQNLKKQKPRLLSNAEIKAYHLRRTNTSQRVFTPGVKETNSSTDFGADFISFGDAEEIAGPSGDWTELFDRDRDFKRGIMDKRMDKTAKIKPKPKEQVDLASMFVIDNEGVKGPAKISKEDCKKIGKKRKIQEGLYVPAKAKRLIGNPNRKSDSQC